MKTAPNLRALRELAEAATPGPWSVSSQYGLVDVFRWPYNPGDDMVAERVDAHDAAFIAAANPTAVLALLDRLEAAEATIDACGCERRKQIIDLIERSSLGSPEAKAVRESVPREVGMAIGKAAEYLGRAEAAEAAVERVRALTDEWRDRDWVDADVTYGSAADSLRAALDGGS